MALVPRYVRAAPFVAPEPFAVPLSIPPVLKPSRMKDGRDLYTLTMRAADAQILPDKSTPIWGFNGRFPGPIIKVTKGEPVVVRQINHLRSGKTIHLHGGHVSSGNDGGPLQSIAPGRSQGLPLPQQPRGGHALVPRPHSPFDIAQRLQGLGGHVHHRGPGRARAQSPARQVRHPADPAGQVASRTTARSSSRTTRMRFSVTSIS